MRVRKSSCVKVFTSFAMQIFYPLMDNIFSVPRYLTSQNYILQVYFHRIYISIYFLCQYLVCIKFPASARLLPFTWILPPPPPSSAVGSTQPCPRGENFQADPSPRATPCNVFSLPHMSVTDICINPDDQYLYQCSYHRLWQ